MKTSKLSLASAMALAGMLSGGAGCASAQSPKAPAAVAAAPAAPTPPTPPRAIAGVGSGSDNKSAITIRRFETAQEEGKERTWLGVGLGEPDEVLVAQLDLKDGAGLLVTYVAKDSPAEKAGLQKNDVLLEMEGQSLVVPAQLQKLVQNRKAGDEVTLKYLRGGKPETLTATLGTTKTRVMSADGDNAFVWRAAPGAFNFVHPPAAANADHMIILEKALKDAKVDQERVKVEIQRSMEQARKAMEEALRTTRKADGSLQDVHRELEQLAKARVLVPNDATVVVRSTDKSTKSMVQADDSGTIVLVKNPKLRLTAHDKDGKLLFDGEIETQAQREQMPEDLRKKVDPMLEKFASGDDE